MLILKTGKEREKTENDVFFSSKKKMLGKRKEKKINNR